MRFAELFVVICCCSFINCAPQFQTEDSDEDQDVVRRPYKTYHPVFRYDAPPFVQSLKFVEQNMKVIQDLLPQASYPVTDPRRHYVIIIGVLGSMVEYLNSNCTTPDYEHNYLPAVDRLLPVIWQNPHLVVSKAESFFKDLGNICKTIQDLVDYYCIKKKPEICNMILLALSHDEYIYHLDLLIKAGELAEMFETYQFEDAARRYNVVSYLIDGEDTFKPLLLKAAEVLNKMYGKKCEP